MYTQYGERSGHRAHSAVLSITASPHFSSIYISSLCVCISLVAQCSLRGLLSGLVVGEQHDFPVLAVCMTFINTLRASS